MSERICETEGSRLKRICGERKARGKRKRKGKKVSGYG